MKKTIIALLALAGISMGEVTTISTSYNVLNGQDIGYGFILSPTDFFMESSSTLGATFLLDSVTLTCSAGGGTYETSAKLAIFERQGTDAAGTFVALSSVTAHSTSAAMTYDFSGTVSLSTDKQYQFLFVASDTDASIFSTTEGNQSTFESVAVTSRFDKTNVQASENFGKNLPTGDGIIYNSAFTSWGGMNMAAVTLTSVKTDAVPEPATATLSLLALAGLCARRRRG